MRPYLPLPFWGGLVLLLFSWSCAPSKPIRVPTATPPPIPTLPPAETPAKVGMWCDVWLSLDGPAGSLASRNPLIGLDAVIQGADAAKVIIRSPSGKTFDVPPYGDIPYGYERRFGSMGGPGLPEVGGPYTCTAVTASGAPIPGAQAQDTYIGGNEPDPPVDVQAKVVAGGVEVAWAASPTIAGAFDPGATPSVGYYAVFLLDAKGNTLYGWNGSGGAAHTHLIPLRRQDFSSEDAGLALEALGDGTYRVDVYARSVAPAGTAGPRDECWSKDSAQSQRLVVDKGQLRIEAP